MKRLKGLNIHFWAYGWVAILSIVILGCALCAHGEANFVMMAFLLQITAQVAECFKNLLGEVVMSGSGQGARETEEII